MLTQSTVTRAQKSNHKPFDVSGFTPEYVYGNWWRLHMTTPITCSGSSVSLDTLFPFRHRLIDARFRHLTSTGADSSAALDLDFGYLRGATYNSELKFSQTKKSDIFIDYSGMDKYFPQTIYRITQNSTNLTRLAVTLKVETLE